MKQVFILAMILIVIYWREETGIGGDGSIGVLCIAN